MNAARRRSGGAGNPRPDKRLPDWLRTLVYASAALLLGSGLLWLLFHYAFAVETDYGTRPHPLTYQWLRLHGAAALFGLVAFGAMLPVHVQQGWKQRRNRRSGAWILALFVALTLSGYLLYYFATETTRGWISIAHWGLGVILPPVLGMHVWLGLRDRAARRRDR